MVIYTVIRGTAVDHEAGGSFGALLPPTRCNLFSTPDHLLLWLATALSTTTTVLCSFWFFFLDGDLPAVTPT